MQFDAAILIFPDLRLDMQLRIQGIALLGSELHNMVTILLLLLLGIFATSSGLEAVETRPRSISTNTSRIVFEDLCAQLPDGAFPDYYQACRMFFICSGGKRVSTFWCTKGFVFSLSSGHCVPPDRMLCPDPNNTSFLPEILQPRFHLAADLCIQGDGVYPNYANGCSSFFFCKGGIKTTFRCPEGYNFDWRTKSCRSSNNFSCNKLSCEDKEDGIYIDSKSYCRRYFECQSGNITEYICPDGTIYNARHHRCTRSSVTRCHGSEAAQCSGIPDGYYPDFAADCKVFGLCMNGGLKTYNCPAGTVFDSKTLTCGSDVRCPKPDVGKCVGKKNGIHPDFESGCRDFYMCLDGLLTHQGSCPQGKLLNPRNGNCQPSSLVACSPIVDANCDQLADGVYPDYDTGCSAYFVCLSGKRVATSYCSGSQLYDLATGKCLPSGFVLCRNRGSSVSPPRLLDTYNCDNRLGMYPEFSSDCRRFITCAYGQIKFHECPEGTWFDPESDSCKEGKVNCRAPFAVATFQCLPGDDGIYVGSNCSEWHECRNGVGFTNICPQGLHYNIRYGKCMGIIESCPPGYKIQRRMFGSSAIAPTEVKETNLNCQSLPNGIYSNSHSCKRFHFCVDGRSVSYACPSNFFYDEDSNQCILTQSNGQCEISRQKRLENQQVYFSCLNLENGMYADFTADCSRYFVCENGNGIPVYCPERQKFNSVKMMCDREDRVRCVPRGDGEDLQTKRLSRPSDELYHVFRPEELYTETYSYIPSGNQPLTKAPVIKSRMWEDYDNNFSMEYDSASPTRNDDVSDSPKSHNSINNEPSNKRQYSKQYTSQVPTITTKLSTSTTSAYAEPAQDFNSKSDRTVRLYQVRTTNRDFDAACRKGDTGFFPDYESGCKMFHICFRTIRKTYSCPSVLLFNPETKNCDLPENVLCSRPEPILETSYNCKENINQFVPDYMSGCKNYIGCINNLPYRFACPKGKIFSKVTSVCESENAYQCEYPDEYNATTFNTYGDNLDRTQSFRHVHGIPGQFYFTCTNKPDGFYPDFTRHCHVFYRCIKGKKFSHYCKQGLLFNPESGICDFEENVACSSGNRTVSSR